VGQKKKYFVRLRSGDVNCTVQPQNSTSVQDENTSTAELKNIVRVFVFG